jgi:hypothetical protein
MNFLSESSYLTLSSSVLFQLECEKRNDFITQLYKSIRLPADMFEIGLSQIMYKPQSELFTENVGGYFLHVWTTGESASIFNMRKISEKFYLTISQFNRDNEKDGIKFDVLMVVQEGGGMKYGIRAPFKSGRFLRPPSPTRKLLGFNQNMYELIENRTIYSENEGDEELYKSLPIGSVIPIEFVMNPNANHIINLDQPHGSTVEDLVTSFNIALLSTEIGITFIAENQSIKMTMDSNNVFLSFSKKLSRLMGASENDVFGSSEHEFLNVDVFRGNHLYIVETDVILPQIYGRQCRSIIKIFQQARDEVSLKT